MSFWHTFRRSRIPPVMPRTFGPVFHSLAICLSPVGHAESGGHTSSPGVISAPCTFIIGSRMSHRPSGICTWPTPVLYSSRPVSGDDARMTAYDSEQASLTAEFQRHSRKCGHTVDYNAMFDEETGEGASARHRDARLPPRTQATRVNRDQIENS